jgi:hypothetical protein
MGTDLSDASTPSDSPVPVDASPAAVPFGMVADANKSKKKLKASSAHQEMSDAKKAGTEKSVLSFDPRSSDMIEIERRTEDAKKNDMQRQRSAAKMKQKMADSRPQGEKDEEAREAAARVEAEKAVADLMAGKKAPSNGKSPCEKCTIL